MGSQPNVAFVSSPKTRPRAHRNLSHSGAGLWLAQMREELETFTFRGLSIFSLQVSSLACNVKPWPQAQKMCGSEVSLVAEGFGTN